MAINSSLTVALICRKIDLKINGSVVKIMLCCHIQLLGSLAPVAVLQVVCGKKEKQLLDKTMISEISLMKFESIQVVSLHSAI